MKTSLIFWINSDDALYVENLSSIEFSQRYPHLVTSTLSADKFIRMVHIGDMPFSPCGGTHVKNLRELEGLEIAKCKR